MSIKMNPSVERFFLEPTPSTALLRRDSGYQKLLCFPQAIGAAANVDRYEQRRFLSVDEFWPWSPETSIWR